MQESRVLTDRLDLTKILYKSDNGNPDKSNYIPKLTSYVLERKHHLGLRIGYLSFVLIRTSHMIIKANGLTFIADDSMEQLIKEKKWHVKENRKGYPFIYAYVRKDAGSRYKQTSILRILYPEIKSALGVRYLNGNPYDVRKENLVTESRSYYGHKIYTPNEESKKSKYRGVGVSYRALIKYQNKLIHLGSYESPVEAAKAYNEAAVKYYGERAILNTLS